MVRRAKLEVKPSHNVTIDSLLPGYFLAVSLMNLIICDVQYIAMSLGGFRPSEPISILRYLVAALDVINGKQFERSRIPRTRVSPDNAENF